MKKCSVKCAVNRLLSFTDRDSQPDVGVVRGGGRSIASLQLHGGPRDRIPRRNGDFVVPVSIWKQ